MATKIHIFLSHGTLILFVVHAWGQDTLPWPIRKRKLYWRMVGQIFVLKLNWNPCCRPPAKFLAKELPGWANLWNQVCMQVWMSMRAQKPNYESSPKSETFATEFLQWIFTHHRFFFNFSDHSQVFIPIFCISHICSLTMFFLEQFLKPAANPAALKFMLNFWTYPVQVGAKSGRTSQASSNSDDSNCAFGK